MIFWEPYEKRHAAVYTAILHRDCGGRVIGDATSPRWVCSKCHLRWAYERLLNFSKQEWADRFLGGTEPMNSAEKLVRIRAQDGRSHTALRVNGLPLAGETKEPFEYQIDITTKGVAQ